MTETIEIKQLDNIATWMIPIKQTDLPSVLKGVFFMDGNPLPDYCITMYNLEWDSENLSLDLPVFAPVQWSFHNSILGRLLLLGAKLTQFTYKIQFEDATLQRSQITPFALGLPIPRWIVYPTMSQVENSHNGDTWKRKNVWFGGRSRIGEYTLRRVVDEDGSYTPAFNYMLTKVQNECLVIVNDSNQKGIK
jgi:hypothetical protein